MRWFPPLVDQAVGGKLAKTRSTVIASITPAGRGGRCRGQWRRAGAAWDSRASTSIAPAVEDPAVARAPRLVLPRAQWVFNIPGHAVAPGVSGRIRIADLTITMWYRWTKRRRCAGGSWCT
jgi:hypothetical protein